MKKGVAINPPSTLRGGVISDVYNFRILFLMSICFAVVVQKHFYFNPECNHSEEIILTVFFLCQVFFFLDRHMVLVISQPGWIPVISWAEKHI